MNILSRDLHRWVARLYAPENDLRSCHSVGLERRTTADQLRPSSPKSWKGEDLSKRWMVQCENLSILHRSYQYWFTHSVNHLCSFMWAREIRKVGQDDRSYCSIVTALGLLVGAIFEQRSRGFAEETSRELVGRLTPGHLQKACRLSMLGLWVKNEWCSQQAFVAIESHPTFKRFRDLGPVCPQILKSSKGAGPDRFIDSKTIPSSLEYFIIFSLYSLICLLQKSTSRIKTKNLWVLQSFTIFKTPQLYMVATRFYFSAGWSSALPGVSFWGPKASFCQFHTPELGCWKWSNDELRVFDERLLMIVVCFSVFRCSWPTKLYCFCSFGARGSCYCFARTPTDHYWWFAARVFAASRHEKNKAETRMSNSILQQTDVLWQRTVSFFQIRRTCLTLLRIVLADLLRDQSLKDTDWNWGYLCFRIVHWVNDRLRFWLQILSFTQACSCTHIWILHEENARFHSLNSSTRLECEMNQPITMFFIVRKGHDMMWCLSKTSAHANQSLALRGNRLSQLSYRICLPSVGWWTVASRSFGSLET